MKTTDRLKRALDSPKLFIRGVNRLYHRRGGLRTENTNGIEVFDKDWDTLIVLDACRYDMFKQINRIDGKLTAVESKGSMTSEWLRANIDGRNLLDTVYVTANPQLERNRKNWDVEFHDIINVWLNEGWDEETGTVLADTMNQVAIEANQQFPNKRLVIHYMQPHYPFVTTDTDFDKGHLSSIEGVGDTVSGEHVWNQKFIGQLDVSQDKLWEMYTANLEYVLTHIERLLTEIQGKTVITSDHGNYVGDRASPIPIQEYGHPRGLYDDVVTCVPWLECMNGKRRRIVSETGSEQTNVEDEKVTDRLRDLGYVD